MSNRHGKHGMRGTLVLCAALALAACDSGRTRPGGPGSNVRPAGRDAASSSADAGADPQRDDGGEPGADAIGEFDALFADGGGAFDANGALDARDTFADAQPEDARGALDAQPAFDAQPGFDAQPAFDANAPLDAQPAADAQAAADAQPAPDAAPPPRDGGLIGDAGTAACTQDSQCASGRCHPLYGQCVPQGQRAFCDSCTTDSECGLPTDHCLDVSAGATFLERVCVQACRATADCPRGYDCTLNGHCYPIAGAIRAHTCASLRDMLAGETCNSFGGPDTCGVTNYDDGTCVPTIGCTVGCNTTQDCPERSTCAPYVVTNYCIPQ